MGRQGETWLVVGSSPSVLDTFAGAVVMHYDAVTITTNAGIGLFERDPALRLDYYHLYDMVACKMFSSRAYAMHKRGTVVVTPRRCESALKERGLLRCDPELINLREPRDEYSVNSAGEVFYTPGVEISARLSGLLCLQYALNRGAKTVVLVGFDGYRSTGNNIVADTFDGRMGKEAGTLHTRHRIQPFVQSAIDRCPEVDFIQYGRPGYHLEGDNYYPIEGPWSRFKAPQ